MSEGEEAGVTPSSRYTQAPVQRFVNTVWFAILPLTCLSLMALLLMLHVYVIKLAKIRPPWIFAVNMSLADLLFCTTALPLFIDAMTNFHGKYHGDIPCLLTIVLAYISLDVYTCCLLFYVLSSIRWIMKRDEDSSIEPLYIKIFLELTWTGCALYNIIDLACTGPFFCVIYFPGSLHGHQIAIITVVGLSLALALVATYAVLHPMCLQRFFAWWDKLCKANCKASGSWTSLEDRDEEVRTGLAHRHGFRDDGESGKTSDSDESGHMETFKALTKNPPPVTEQLDYRTQSYYGALSHHNIRILPTLVEVDEEDGSFYKKESTNGDSPLSRNSGSLSTRSSRSLRRRSLTFRQRDTKSAWGELINQLMSAKGRKAADGTDRPVVGKEEAIQRDSLIAKKVKSKWLLRVASSKAQNAPKVGKVKKARIVPMGAESMERFEKLLDSKIEESPMDGSLTEQEKAWNFSSNRPARADEESNDMWAHPRSHLNELFMWHKDTNPTQATPSLYCSDHRQGSETAPRAGRTKTIRDFSLGNGHTVAPASSDSCRVEEPEMICRHTGGEIRIEQETKAECCEDCHSEGNTITWIGNERPHSSKQEITNHSELASSLQVIGELSRPTRPNSRVPAAFLNSSSGGAYPQDYSNNMLQDSDVTRGEGAEWEDRARKPVTLKPTFKVADSEPAFSKTKQLFFRQMWLVLLTVTFTFLPLHIFHLVTCLRDSQQCHALEPFCHSFGSHDGSRFLCNWYIALFAVSLLRPILVSAIFLINGPEPCS